MWEELVLSLGSVHLSLMAAIGIWLWIDPHRFGATVPCDPSLTVVGHSVRFSNSSLRIVSLLVYSLLLLPIINLLPPFYFFLTLHILYNKSRQTHARFWARCQLIADYLKVRRDTTPSDDTTASDDSTLSDDIAPIPDTTPSRNGPARIYTAFLIVGVLCLFITNLIFLIDIELTLRRNKPFQSSGENDWGFGQVLALLLLIVPLRDFVNSLAEINEKVRQGVQPEFKMALREAMISKNCNEEHFTTLIKRGANPNTTVKGERTSYCLYAELFDCML